MDQLLHTLDIDNLSSLTEEAKQLAMSSLEKGQVIYLPFYSFHMDSTEQEQLLSDKILDGKHKNLSFDYRTKRLGGIDSNAGNAPLTTLLKIFMQRYAEFAKSLVNSLFPEYENALLWGRTSYQAAEIKGRTSSRRKDDKRLHVDSFPATPVNGQRILRVFTNVNPYGEPRVWHLGESFAKALAHFSSSIPPYNRTIAKLLQLIKVTKTLRSAYDHYQLNLHDSMKLDDGYQRTVNKQRIEFPAQSSWVGFTDQVTHAALSGQFLLEQLFYLPVHAMNNPELSPLRYWEKEKKFRILDMPERIDV
ncbi:Kdo hydroxylase family protein [Legionella cardiaca]|uniref:Kdo hydroxylase family protein n=1 Tax=Legionella cardiaca TaxID=1071983 RepID=A0ABY8ASV8_9GAMM|nr:Kdo hydroxylase family protein [Legionella cardiaca]WED43759.1 Kdo hydroxylase family protein [Legionella cardiaca]